MTQPKTEMETIFVTNGGSGGGGGSTPNSSTTNSSTDSDAANPTTTSSASTSTPATTTSSGTTTTVLQLTNGTPNGPGLQKVVLEDLSFFSGGGGATSPASKKRSAAGAKNEIETTIYVTASTNGGTDNGTDSTTLLVNGSGEPGPGLQKIVLEDIKLEDYYNETMEESLCKQFKFQITNNELKMMIENSVLETNTAKPYRYLTGNFIRVFERHVELFEKQKIPIQKRNNVVYEESLRNNTVYMRVNGDCKLCPKANRVRYIILTFNTRNFPYFPIFFG